jgi:competence ComEA-like helix-hairpin-helix protein
MKALIRFIRGIRLSRQESIAILAVFGLYAVGVTWRYVQKSAGTYDAAYYARLDSASGIGALSPISYMNVALADTVPKHEESEDSVTTSDAAEESLDMKTGRININEATERQLMLLPRIGPALARRIAVYREKTGPFKATSDLLNVKGIGVKTLKGFEGMIVVE